ncbi:hypothetical protein [Limnohabitans sp. T6-20]|uniref:hypothetical protein n=1 Tax=Limnohabitans sp. T6-20 TaxID=1100725 RepID=UPI000D35BD99|nr:hypothetical protein [Limnohabitans sp. T6-20]PUE10291.1 hypothetical protein B9Z33_09360 [Limnohabitans sp. T6-20]
MKRLQLYYWYIGVPVALVFLGALVFWDAIISTVEGNPHPQINYIIFLLVAAGCYQMLSHVRRINKEGSLFRQYRLMVDNGATEEQLQLAILEMSKKHDVVSLIELIQGLRGKALTSVQHAAIESEMERFSARQTRRLMMSQFMGGMMVGMGLLGTFIGLLGALAEIGKLIGSFNLGAGMIDPVAAISELVARLTAPMQAMGVAFSASLFGVLGSLIMGVLSVGVRSASSDLVSFVHSDTSLMLDIAQETEGGVLDLNPVAQALGELAEHSPLLRGLALALDHSERRVREMMMGMGTLMARLETNSHGTSSLIQQIGQQADQQDRLLSLVAQMQSSQNQLAERQAQMADAHVQMAKHLEQHTDTMARALGVQNQQHAEHAQAQQNLWSQQAELQKDILQQQNKTFEKLLQAQHDQSSAQMRAQNTLWQTYLEQQQNMLRNKEETLASQANLERQNRNNQWGQWVQVQEAGLQKMVDHLSGTQRVLAEYTSHADRWSEQLQLEQQRQGQVHADVTKLLQKNSQNQQNERESSQAMLSRMDAMLQEAQFRNEQIVAFLSSLTSQAHQKSA